MSTAVLDPRAGELATEPLWGPPPAPLVDSFRGGVPVEANLERWMTALLEDLNRGDAVACLACGDPSGLRAAREGGPAACCNCGSTLA